MILHAFRLILSLNLLFVTISQLTSIEKTPWMHQVVHFKSNSKSTRSENASFTPTKHPYDSFMSKRMQGKLDLFGSITKLVFIGDSSLHRLNRNWDRWNGLEEKHGALNFAGPAHKTENTLSLVQTKNFLSRITSDPLVVVSVGVSNLKSRDSPKSIATAIDLIVQSLLNMISKRKILLLTLPPSPNEQYHLASTQVNTLLESTWKKEKTAQNPHITLVDISPIFLTSSSSTSSSSSSIPFSSINSSYFLFDNLTLSVLGSDRLFEYLSENYFLSLPHIPYNPRLNLTTSSSFSSSSASSSASSLLSSKSKTTAFTGSMIRSATPFTLHKKKQTNSTTSSSSTSSSSSTPTSDGSKVTKKKQEDPFTKLTSSSSSYQKSSPLTKTTTTPSS